MEQFAGWDALDGITVYFNHQSVGANIVDGIRDISGDHVRVVGLEDASAASGSGLTFVHSTLGANLDPLSKYDGFSEGLAQLSDPDIVFVKLCYVDIDAWTNVESRFEQYTSFMQNLESRYPDVFFLHFTSPLVSPNFDLLSTLKNAVKRVIGRPRWGFEDNLRRMQFNDMMRAEYGSGMSLFDLARLESVQSDRTASTRSLGEEQFEVMAREYSSDGGHLNQLGSRRVAEALLEHLADIAREL